MLDPRNPFDDEQHLETRPDIAEYLNDLQRKIAQDYQSAGEWRSKQRTNYLRRYALLNRDPDFPWPNSSNIVIPLSDQMIDRLKPGYLNVLTPTPMFSFLPVLDESVSKSRNAEFFLDWLLKYGIEGFYRENAILIDDILQKGFGLMKTTWRYKKQTEMVKIRLDRLPGRLKNLSVLPRGTAKTAEYLFLVSDRTVSPLTREEFDAREKQIRQIIQAEYALTDEDPINRKATDKIMKFFRSGDFEVEVKMNVERENGPFVKSTDPMNIITPSWSTDIESIQRITERCMFTEDSLKTAVRDMGFNEEAVEMITEGRTDTYAKGLSAKLDALDYEKQQREGTFDHEGEIYEIYESCCLYDIDGDGIGERCVLTWHPKSKIPLKLIPLPYDHGQWPYTQFRFEMNDGRFYSPRGIPEKSKDHEEEVTQQHRAKLNRATIANALTFKKRMGSPLLVNQIRWVPGEFIPVQRMDDIEPIVVPNLDLSYAQEEAILRSSLENYIGTSDFAITNPLSSSNDSRTATEVSAIQQIASTSMGYRIQLYLDGLKRVAGQVWDLWIQLGPDDVWIRVANDEPVRMTKREIVGNYDLIPRASTGTTNPAFEEQKALQRIQVLSQLAPFMQNNPEYKPINFGYLIEDWLSRGDRMVARRIIEKRSPQEIAAIQQQMAQQQQAQQAIANNQPIPLSQFQRQLQQAEREAPHGANQQITAG